MAAFVIYMVFSTIFAVFFTKLSDKRIPNPIRLRCSACGSNLHLRLKGGWSIFERIIYAVALWFVILQPKIPLWIGLSLLLPFVLAWGLAVKRLVESYWMWRHPLRCQGGGHFVPQPTA